jgi:uncharacterized protein YjbI with pentapeptide repeats
MKTYLQKAITILAILFLLTISGIFVLGILNQTLVSKVWGTVEETRQYTDQKTGETVITTNRTVWDLANLLLVPLVISVGGYLLNQTQQIQNLKFNELQNENQRKIALDRDQEQTLQNYLDKMSELLLEKKLSVTKDKVVLNLARSRTLTILRSLNNRYLDIEGRGRNRRKGSLARFLYEMNLINGKRSVISLRRANLSYAFMHSDEFSKANFEYAYLDGADLRNSNLRGAFLTKADLPSVRLNGAHLEGANLTKANLKKANLEGAYLDGAILDGADFEGAIMPDGSIHE